MYQRCYYSPSQGVIVAIVGADYARGSGIKEDYPDAVCIGVGIAIDTIRATYKTDPALISEEQFYDALECLPPENWCKFGNDGEYFQMREYYTYDITSYYVRTPGGEFYTFRNVTWLKPDQIMELLK